MSRFALIVTVMLAWTLAHAPPGWAAWTWPVRGEVITSYRNGDDPYAGGQHRGIDIAGDVGSPVVAATAGAIRFAGIAGSLGLTISLRTSDDRYDTSYLHLDSVSVAKGDRVAAGDRLGTVGTSGSRSAAAPHLHFGVRDAGSAQAYHDPLGFLTPLATTGEPRPTTPAPLPVAVPAAPAPHPTPRAMPVSEPKRVPVPRATRAPRPVPAPRHRTDAERADRRVPRAAPVPRHAPGGVRAPLHGSGLVYAPGDPSTVAAPRQRGEVSAPRHGTAVHASDPSREGAPGQRSAEIGVARRGLAEARVRRGPSGVAQTAISRAALDDPGRRPAAPTVGATTGREGGPDAGWAFACLGLLLAAALVGSSERNRAVVKRRGASVGRALGPLLGRG